MASRGLPWLLLVAAIPCAALAQLPKDNPVVDAAVRIGARGLKDGAAPASSPTRFSPNGKHEFISKYAAALYDTEEERKSFEAVALQLLDNYENSARPLALANDASAAFAFSLSVLYSVCRSEELPDAAFTALAKRFQATLDTPEVRGATDAKKQEAYEFALCSVTVVLSVVASANSEAELEKVRTLAQTQIQALVGAKLDQLSFKGGEWAIRGSAEGKTTGGSGLAPGFTFQPPPNWVRDGQWHVFTVQEGDNVTSAMVRFPASIPAAGNMGDALRMVWKENVPAPLVNAAGGMVYRRYVGAKLFAQFIFGKGREEGRKSDTVFTLFLIDCGNVWQPVIVAQTYRDLTMPGIEDFSSQYSFPKSADYAEAMLATFRCPNAPNQALAPRDALAGDYLYGSSNSMQWENIYTGATSMTFVSSGGSLSLAKDGTFTYTFTSANGQVGATTFRSAKGAGTYSIQGDILTCTYTSYDQGDGYKRKETKYRIAGLTAFSDGVKVMVLFDDLNIPVNNVTVAQRGTWYSTKKAAKSPPR